MIINKSISDVSKGIAIIFVILSHIPRVVDIPHSELLNPLGYLGVGVFLFLSGYGLEASYCSHGISGFWTRRFRKIIPACTIVTLLISIISFIIGYPEFSIIDIIFGSIGLSDSVNPVTWYLALMYFCYFCFYILHKTMVNNKLIAVFIANFILIISLAFSNTSCNMWGLNAASFSFGLLTYSGGGKTA